MLGLYIIILTCLVTLISCGELNYSPYIAKTDSKSLNTRNLKKINALESTVSSNYKIAVISDTHDYYKELEDQVKYINKNKDEIAFVIHTGDATNLGLIQEYELFLDELEELEVPFLVVIGNHDMLSNGTELYKQLFGNDLNFSFDFKQSRFVLFNNNNWESSSKAPNTDFIESELSSSGQTHNLLFAHVQFDDSDRFTTSEIGVVEKLVSDYGVEYVLSGHNHNPGTGTFATATRLTVGSPSKGKFVILSIEDSGITHEYIKF